MGGAKAPLREKSHKGNPPYPPLSGGQEKAKPPQPGGGESPFYTPLTRGGRGGCFSWREPAPPPFGIIYPVIPLYGGDRKTRRTHSQTYMSDPYVKRDSSVGADPCVRPPLFLNVIPAHARWFCRDRPPCLSCSSWLSFVRTGTEACPYDEQFDDRDPLPPQGGLFNNMLLRFIL